ncbi:MAG: hypothetical protein SV375_19820 [Thermodesulfobacteriota bacterium]|nr:hypothetical protein [Thermodesulfobacteriota bacterium]
MKRNDNKSPIYVTAGLIQVKGKLLITKRPEEVTWKVYRSFQAANRNRGRPWKSVWKER